MFKNILGVDVGICGALSFYDGEELMCYEMPVFKRNKTSKVDCHAVDKIIKINKPSHAYIEQVNAFKMGATSAYGFGWNCGVIEAILCCNNVPFSYVTPQIWKKEMQCPTDKSAARMRAKQLFPKFSDNWSLKRQDGVAESALISLYGWNRS